MEPIYRDFIKDAFVFFVVFLVLTFLIYFALDATINLIIPNDRYEEPIGSAVKVISQDSNESLHRIIDYWRFFIEFGE